MASRMTDTSAMSTRPRRRAVRARTGSDRGGLCAVAPPSPGSRPVKSRRKHRVLPSPWTLEKTMGDRSQCSLAMSRSLSEPALLQDWPC